VRRDAPGQKQSVPWEQPQRLEQSQPCRKKWERKRKGVIKELFSKVSLKTNFSSIEKKDDYQKRYII
jgi:hypothetical protein